MAELSTSARSQIPATAVNLDENSNKISFGATFIPIAADRAVSPNASPNFYLTSKSDLLNRDANWDPVLGSQVDVSSFVTNATSEKTYAYPVVALTTIGDDGFHGNRLLMRGFRLGYRFGQ